MAYTIVDEIKESFKKGSSLTKLIYINLGVFVAIKLLYAFFFIIKASIGGRPNYLDWPVLDYLMLPSDIGTAFLRPWTFFTYMFLHFEFFHILFNLLFLFWFGRIFLKYLTEKQLLTTYLLGGLVGGLLFIISYNVFPGLNDIFIKPKLLGASAGVMGVTVAISFYAPNYTVYLPFIGPVKIKYIAIFYLVMDFIQIAGDNTGGHIAHLGGAFYGYMFATRLQKGKDIGRGFSHVVDSIATLFKPKPKMKVSYKNSARGMTDMEYNQTKAATQIEIDRILDKIAKSGYESLSKKEKEILFKMSNKS